MPNLKELWERRAQSQPFKMRDAAYNFTQLIYNSVDPQQENALQLSYRPYNWDNVDLMGSGDVKPVVNQTRIIVNHHTSIFARPPKTWALAAGQKDQDAAGRRSGLLSSIFRRSNLTALHARNVHWLSLRGDCVFAGDWRTRKEGTKESGVFLRTYDPAWCYPSFDPDDLGACRDMLITFQVPALWAREAYHVDLPQDGSMVRIFHYWTDTAFQLQVEDVPVESMTRRHDLGQVPFRWVFGDPSGLMGQSDVREVPKLQDLYNENLLLALDAIRRSVDPAYWATGLKKNVAPEPGVATALPEGATVGQWPTGGDPQIILGLAATLKEAIGEMAGVSPISSSGHAEGSIVTGAAVRHQVEAAEARTEQRKELLQSAYARISETLLAIAREHFAEIPMSFLGENGVDSLRGEDIGDFLQCEAEYGGFLGLSAQDRVRVALEGFGRLWSRRFAIKMADLPGVEPDQMGREIDQFQVEQATLTARAQAAAQQAAGGGQGGAPQPGMMPQRPQGPPQPGAEKLRSALGLPQPPVPASA